MCQHLPTGDFVEIEVTERNKDNSLKLFSGTKDDPKHGFLINYDLEYPSKIHERTEHCPFFHKKNNQN